jgi:hypothetical protein
MSRWFWNMVFECAVPSFPEFPAVPSFPPSFPSFARGSPPEFRPEFPFQGREALAGEAGGETETGERG